MRAVGSAHFKVGLAVAAVLGVGIGAYVNLDSGANDDPAAPAPPCESPIGVPIAMDEFGCARLQQYLDGAIAVWSTCPTHANLSATRLLDDYVWCMSGPFQQALLNEISHSMMCQDGQTNGWCRADADQDGDVDLHDYWVIQANYEGEPR